MMQKKILFILLTLSFFMSRGQSQDIKIGLFYDELVSSVVFHCTEGSYTVYPVPGDPVRFAKGDIFYITLLNEKLQLNNGDIIIGSFQSVEFRDNALNGRIRIKPVEPAQEAANYTGNFHMDIVHEAIHLINTLPFDEYLAGVVEAEAGPGAPFEFFKAQAVICRTYAMKNWDRHAGEGFNLCDNAHCQAFHGVSDDNPDIKTAVLATHKIVVTNKYSYLIDAAYHSNSGGETQRAKGFWPGDHDYLQAIVDPFSEGQRNYSWQETLQFDTWRAYLATKDIDIADADTSDLLINQDHRERFFIINEDTLSLRDIREDLGFQSSFFSMELENDKILINGRGYGHGIGLSQEGAMEMARQGYSFTDILRFYYHQVLIKNYELIPVSELPVEFRES